MNAFYNFPTYSVKIVFGLNIRSLKSTYDPIFVAGIQEKIVSDDAAKSYIQMANNKVWEKLNEKTNRFVKMYDKIVSLFLLEI
jgi:hypothetical protein